MISPKEYAKIQKETDIAIKKGWDSSKIEWRKMALEIIYNLCLKKERFTANDFGEEIKNNSLKTHDNRAIGGVIIIARKFGWVENTGEYEARLSKDFHKGGMSSIWKSLIFGKIQQEEMPPITWHRGKRTFMHLGEGKFVINGSDGKQYRVEFGKNGYRKCECEASRFYPGKKCKHILIIEKYIKEKLAEKAEKNQNKLF